MDEKNEKTIQETSQERSLMRVKPFSKTTKLVFVGIVALLMSIPMFMVTGLINDREYTQAKAVEEVQQKWSRAQTITGPYLDFEYKVVEKNDSGKLEETFQRRILLPDELLINGGLNTEILNRGIYDVNVYESMLTLKGTFGVDELIKDGVDLNRLNWSRVAVCLNLSDLRGLCEQVTISLGDSLYSLEPGMDGKGLGNSGLHTLVDLSEMKMGNKLAFEVEMQLKGSSSMHFIPLGKSTEVTLRANWITPSFVGSFLPDERKIFIHSTNEFYAHWKVLNLNRSYPQVMSHTDREISKSSFGVELLIPVDEYQQSMRSVKYAFLIIALTFVVVFLAEILCRVRIHVLQYLLVGLALCLFYCLLLSFSEHIGFDWAYLTASVMTIALVGGYMLGIIGRRMPALIMTSLLGILYLYIFVMIQLETLALLVGSLGLFVILAALMYFTRKIDWFND